MLYKNSIEAAIKASAPIVAIPVEGAAPLCIRRELLKRALKDVTITSVEITCHGSGRWVLCIQGRAYYGLTKTSCKIVALDRAVALLEIGRWRDRQVAERLKIALQGVLSKPEQRALKLALAAKAGIAELIAAQRIEASIIAEARRHAKQEMHPISPNDREDLMESYLAFRHGNRKIGSVILYKIGKLQAELDKLTEKKTVQRRGTGRRNRGPLVHINRVRRAGNVALVADLMAQIGMLKAEFQAAYPPVWQEPDPRYSWATGRWKDTFIKQRPKGGWVERQAHGSDESWRWGWHEDRYDRRAMAQRLREARADIRALTPPETEEDFAIAA